MAIQLSAFVEDDSIVLQFTRVLDTYEFGGDAEDDEDSGGQADRAYWEKRASRESLEVFDSIVVLLSTQGGGPRVTYNRGHIAVGTTGYNFCWFHPRRAGHCRVHFKIPVEQRQSVVGRLEGADIEAAIKGRSYVQMRLAKDDVGKNRQLLGEVFGIAEQWSRR